LKPQKDLTTNHVATILSVLSAHGIRLEQRFCGTHFGKALVASGGFFIFGSVYVTATLSFEDRNKNEVWRAFGWSSTGKRVYV